MKRNRFILWLPTAATLFLALGLWMGYTITTNRLKVTAPRTTQSAAAGSKIDYSLSLIISCIRFSTMVSVSILST